MAYEFDSTGKLKSPSAEDAAKVDGHASIIVLNQGTLQDGTHYWAYIAVKPGKYQEFIHYMSEKRPLALKDYGDVLKYGFDEEVPEFIKQEMACTHGFDEKYLEQLEQDVQHAQSAFREQQESSRIADIISALKNRRPTHPDD